MAKKTEEYDPSLTGIVLTAVFCVFIGLSLAAINTSLLPIKIVKALPALEDREKKMVYYIPGNENGGNTWKVKANAYLQQDPGTLNLNEAELNAWSRNAFKSDTRNKDDGEGFGFKAKIAPPNFRIYDDKLQISVKMDISIMGMSGNVICNSTGLFYNLRGNYINHANSVFIGACPIPSIANLPNSIVKYFGNKFLESEVSDELRGPWSQLNDVRVVKDRLKLVR